jgi:hypothetical protein
MGWTPVGAPLLVPIARPLTGGARYVNEYFAQATCAYFGVNQGQGKELAFLRAEDPWIVAKLGEIYGPPDAALLTGFKVHPRSDRRAES